MIVLNFVVLQVLAWLNGRKVCLALIKLFVNVRCYWEMAGTANFIRLVL